jgi:hypothetical protein
MADDGNYVHDESPARVDIYRQHLPDHGASDGGGANR